MKNSVWFVAPVLGLAAMVVPVLVWPPAFPWLLGFTTVSLLPVAALLEVRVDSSSHTLVPIGVLRRLRRSRSGGGFHIAPFHEERCDGSEVVSNRKDKVRVVANVGSGMAAHQLPRPVLLYSGG